MIVHMCYMHSAVLDAQHRRRVDGRALEDARVELRRRALRDKQGDNERGKTNHHTRTPRTAAAVVEDDDDGGGGGGGGGRGGRGRGRGRGREQRREQVQEQEQKLDTQRQEQERKQQWSCTMGRSGRVWLLPLRAGRSSAAACSPGRRTRACGGHVFRGTARKGSV